MAEEHNRIDHNLMLLELFLGDIPELIEEWEQLGGGERVAWAVDWNDLLSRVRRILEPAYRAGEMTEVQRQRYETASARLKQLAPAVEEAMQVI